MNFYWKLKHAQIRQYRDTHIDRVLQYILLILLITIVFSEAQNIYGQLIARNEYNINNRVVVEAAASGEPEVSTQDLSSVGEGKPSPDQGIREKINKAFPNDPDMIKIAIAESHLKPDAVHVNSNGTKDCGIFQINSVHGYACEWLKNPDNNIKAAKEVYNKQGKWAWCSYQYAIINNKAI
jgi:hypothetical protein